MGDILSQLVAWEKAGPVGLLLLFLLGVAWLCRWLLVQLLRDKDSQIARLEHMNDKLSDETAGTLKQILDAVRDSREVRR